MELGHVVNLIPESPPPESGSMVGEVREREVKGDVREGEVKGDVREGEVKGEEGSFFGLPVTVQALLEEHRGIKELYGDIALLSAWVVCLASATPALCPVQIGRNGVYGCHACWLEGTCSTACLPAAGRPWLPRYSSSGSCYSNRKTCSLSFPTSPSCRRRYAYIHTASTNPINFFSFYV